MQASTDSWTAVVVAAAARTAARGSGKKPDGPGGGPDKPGLTRAGKSGKSERWMEKTPLRRRRWREGEAEGGRVAEAREGERDGKKAEFPASL